MKNSECIFICDQYTEYSDNTLSADIRSKVDTHLATCAACQKVFRELDQVLGGLHQLQTIKASPDFTQKLQQRITADSTRTPWQQFYMSSYTKVAGYAIAAGLVVAIGLNFVIDPISAPGGRSGSNFAVEAPATDQETGTLAGTDDSLTSGADSLTLNRNTIQSGSSTLQLVSGSSK